MIEEMKTPELSVIIANYNNERYIRQCLDSVLSQTFTDLEIVIADDVSTDGSPGIIREYMNRYPEIVRGVFREKNGGPGWSRHDAILHSRGAYLTTLDSDDYYYQSGKLEQEMAVIRHYRENLCQDVIAFSDYAMIRPDGSLITLMGQRQTIVEGNILAHVITRDCLIPRDFIMSRDLYFSIGGYRLDLYHHEDWDLKIRLAALASFRCSGHTGVAYRRNPNGLSAAEHPHRTIRIWRVFIDNIHLIAPEQREHITGAFLAGMRERDRLWLALPKYARKPWRKALMKLRLFFLHIRWRRALFNHLYSLKQQMRNKEA